MTVKTTVMLHSLLQSVPCFPSELFSRPGFFILTVDSTVCLICMCSVILLFTSQLLFLAISITWKLTKTTSKSKNTNKLQKQFMVALGLQVIIPLAVFGYPALYVSSSVLNNYNNQGWLFLKMQLSICFSCYKRSFLNFELSRTFFHDHHAHRAPPVSRCSVESTSHSEGHSRHEQRIEDLENWGRSSRFLDLNSFETFWYC